MSKNEWMKKYLDYASEIFNKPKKVDQLYNSYNTKDKQKYTFPLHTELMDKIQPIRSIVGKLPMKMTFIDDAGRVFDYNKDTKSYLFKYSSIYMKELMDLIIK